MAFYPIQESYQGVLYAYCIPENDRFKIVDDLSTLEIVHLTTIGLSSFNIKNKVPSYIPTHSQYINKEDHKNINIKYGNIRKENNNHDIQLQR